MLLGKNFFFFSEMSICLTFVHLLKSVSVICVCLMFLTVPAPALQITRISSLNRDCLLSKDYFHLFATCVCGNIMLRLVCCDCSGPGYIIIFFRFS